jgi:outer membrane protein assembly factor BamB
VHCFTTRNSELGLWDLDRQEWKWEKDFDTGSNDMPNQMTGEQTMATNGDLTIARFDQATAADGLTPGSNRSYVKAFSNTDGKELWTFETPHGVSDVNAAAGQELVLVVANGKSVTALDSSGMPRWSRDDSGWDKTTSAEFVDLDGRFVGRTVSHIGDLSKPLEDTELIRTEDGTTVRTAEGVKTYGSSPLVQIQENPASRDARTEYLDLATGNSFFWDYAVDHSAAVPQGVIIGYRADYMTKVGDVLRFMDKTGAKLWDLPETLQASFEVRGPNLYVTNGQGQVHRVDPATGNEVKRNSAVPTDANTTWELYDGSSVAGRGDIAAVPLSI